MICNLGYFFWGIYAASPANKNWPLFISLGCFGLVLLSKD